MDMAVRYQDNRRALAVGRRLSYRYHRHVLTGLSFLIEPEQSVIVIASFASAYHRPNQKELDEIMLPGEVIDKSLTDLIHSVPERTMMLMGDGLHMFEIYYRARHGLDDRDPIVL